MSSQRTIVTTVGNSIVGIQANGYGTISARLVRTTCLIGRIAFGAVADSPTRWVWLIALNIAGKGTQNCHGKNC